jgi:heme/copper-type cytochrome/quinol oxidase subunit 2
MNESHNIDTQKQRSERQREGTMPKETFYCTAPCLFMVGLGWTSYRVIETHPNPHRYVHVPTDTAAISYQL